MSQQRYFMNWRSKTIHKLNEKRSTGYVTWGKCGWDVSSPVIKANSVEALREKALDASLCAECFTAGSRGGEREGRDS